MTHDFSKKVLIGNEGDFPCLGNDRSEPQLSNPQWISKQPKKQSKVNYNRLR